MHRFVAAVLALCSVPLAVLALTPSPTDRCHAAGYAQALHIVQPDGETREWLCFTPPADDTSAPKFAYLKEI
jgi:poly(3-hydroxybutyrate) depolymerase